MKGKPSKKLPEVVLRNGKPRAVILDINKYEDMLERLEDLEDLKTLQALKKKPLKFKKLGDFLREHPLGV